jgi:hypothetical protein
MQRSTTSPRRLKVWGDSMMNKLPGLSRKRRKRHASKKRRQALAREDRTS